MKYIIDKPIVLVGMMGSGKSTIGKRLARKLKWRFYDSDKVIEESEGLSVVEIHDFKGKEYFRMKEAESMRKLLDCGIAVIATGGETFINNEIRALIRKKAISVWISTNPEILYERIDRRNTRPEFNCSDKMAVLMRMLEAYNPIYSEADIKLENQGYDTYFVLDTFMLRLKKYIKKSV